MIPILYSVYEDSFKSNGLGRLNDCITCKVTEERNGIFELEMEYPATGLLFNDIQIGCYILATHDDNGDGQPFQIYKITKPIDGICSYYAHHISYQLSKVAVSPFTANSCESAVNQLKSKSMSRHRFEFYTDIVSNASIKSLIPSTVRSLMGGSENSLLDVYGGEYEYDMFTVSLLKRRGKDTSVIIQYGKNLTDFEFETDSSDMYTAIAPYWADSNGEVSTLCLPEGYVTIPGSPTYIETLTTDNDENLLTDVGDTFTTVYYDLSVIPYDLSGEFEEMPTVNELRNKALEITRSTTPWKPTENIKVDFVRLCQTEDYKDIAPLEKVNLCDTVTVNYPQYGLSIERMKVVRVVWDVLADRYTDMELGASSTSFSDTISATIENKIEKSEAYGYLSAFIGFFSKLMSNSLGVYTTKEMTANGTYQYYLHNKPKRSESQYQWTVTDTAYMVSTNYGSSWTNVGSDSMITNSIIKRLY